MKSRCQNIPTDPLVSYYEAPRPIDWSKQFQKTELQKPLDVEIGSGLGEFLVQMAQKNPDRNFIGIEHDFKRVKKILKKVPRTSGPAGNIRVLKADAVVALQRFFNLSTINKVYCLFPCPWPKKKHIKHRLFSSDFLRLLNSRLIEEGEVQMATDYLPYFHWVQDQVKETGFKATTQIIKPRFGTKFERKWMEEGQEEFFQLSLVKEKHIEVPLERDVSLKGYSVEHFDPRKFRLLNSVDEVSIIQKNFLFDSQQNKAMVHVVVVERSITQHLWIMVAKGPALGREGEAWYIKKAEGQSVLPTQGVARALQYVYQTIKNSQ